MIRTRVRKLLAPGKKLLPAAFMALALCPLTAELAFARPQSNTDSVGAAVQPRAVLPLQIGFARGGTALYITPEVGVDPSAGADIVATAQEVAKGFGANFIPTNFSTLPNSPAVRNIFVFSTQGNVLSATPTPAGPGDTNANYSPLWQVNLVTWNPGSTVTVLTSTEEVEAAQNAGQVAVTPTPIIVECSVIFSLSPGGVLPDSKVVLDALNAAAGGNVSSKVSLPLQAGFYNNKTALYITPEVGVTPGSTFTSLAQTVAEGFNSNFVPTAFGTLPGSEAVDDIFVFTNFSQGNVLASAPNPAGPANTKTDYSPLWQVSLVSWNAGHRARALTSQAEILNAAAAGDVTITKTNITVECSVIFTPSGGLLPGVKILGDDDQFGGNSGDRY
ncbi:MAG: hypothetical protein WB621_03625 [Candidatus Acidiferrales bacterium]